MNMGLHLVTTSEVSMSDLTCSDTRLGTTAHQRRKPTQKSAARALFTESRPGRTNAARQAPTVAVGACFFCAAYLRTSMAVMVNWPPTLSAEKRTLSCTC